MKLFEGLEAKDFTTVDIYGREVKLSDFKGKKIILSFYRNVSCPFCNRRVHRVMSYNGSFQRNNIQLIFLFESSTDKLNKSVLHQGISPWPLIGDPDKHIYKKYGVESSVFKMLKTLYYGNMKEAKEELKDYTLLEDKDATLFLIPADFFIDENFRIVKAHYGAHIDDHVDFEEIKKFTGVV